MSRLFSLQAHIYFILFSVFALATLLNVTVDDAALTGSVVPVYLPAPSDWKQGNGCLTCSTNPDPAFAYDGTWHNGRLYPDIMLVPGFEVTFVGSGLYIYFILANTIPNDTLSTLTNVTFFLDGTQVSSFRHVPSTDTGFEYNQAVYANGSIPYGQHTMTVMPINDSVNSVLMLFDYLVYTTENGTSPSPTSSSGPDIGAIAGGAAGGVSALLLVTAAVLYYWRYKRRISRKPPLPATRTVEPYAVSPEVAPICSQVTSLSTQQTRTESPKLVSRHGPTVGGSPTTTQPLNLSTPPHPSSNASSNNGTTEILEQVGMLRDEVARLRHDRDMGWNDTELPPEYS